MEIVETYSYYTKEYIIKNADIINWEDACTITHFDILSELSDDYSDMFDWHVISNREEISVEFIRKHIKKINFNVLCLSIPIEFIYEICETEGLRIGPFAWLCISERDISEKFVRKHYEKINWVQFSKNNSMELFSEKFFIDFKNHIQWNVVLATKSFTLGFKERFKHKKIIK